MIELNSYKKMDGQYPNKTEDLLSEINVWYSEASVSEEAWKANNIHIDEFDVYRNITRDKWLGESISVFNLFLENLKGKRDKLLFLHVPLKECAEHEELVKLEFDWIEENLHEFIPPPSFMCAPYEYLESFYRFTLTKINSDSLLEMYNFSSGELSFYCRIKCDIHDNLYDREIYIFESGADRYLL